MAPGRGLCGCHCRSGDGSGSGSKAKPGPDAPGSETGVGSLAAPLPVNAVGRVRAEPTAGAAVHLQFKTLAGFAVLIQAPREQGESLPMGTTVQDSQGRVVGINTFIFSQSGGSEGLSVHFAVMVGP